MADMTRTDLGRIVVMANCTHMSLAQALRNSGLFSRVDSVEIYSLPEAERENIARMAEDCDHVLTLEHGDRFGPLATAALRARLGDRVHSLPTPFFSGLAPDMAYLIHEGNIARSEAVLGDYHSALLLADLQSGLAGDEIVDRYVSGAAFDRLDVEGIWNDNIAALQAREAETDIALSGYIEAEARAGRLAGQFLSFNHPTEALIDHIARSLITRLGGAAPAAPLLSAEQHNLYSDAFWPLHPAVARRLNLPAPPEPVFKRPRRMGGDHLSLTEFAERSLSFFRDSPDSGKFRVVTPNYLPDRIAPVTASNNSRKKARSPAMSPPPNVVLTHFGRSGSTVLSELLKQHSHIAWLDEYFSLKWIRDRSSYNFSLAQMLDMIKAETDRIHARKPHVLVGYEIKLMNFLQNPSCNLVDYVAAVSDPAQNVHVVLRRRNTLRRLCSLYKAEQTKVYHRRDGSDGYTDKTFAINFDNLVDYDTRQRGATMVELIANVRAREESVLANYRKLGITYRELFYEDHIEADPRIGYRKIIEFLGLAPEPAEPTLSKTIKPLRVDLRNYEQLEAALKGSDYEWMLD